MFSEHRLLEEELNALNRIAVQETCIIMVAKVFCIGKMIVTHIAGFPRVKAHHVGHFVETFEYSVGLSEVVESCHCRVPEKLVDSSFTQVALDTPLC
jgi:hypothetical protein